MNAWPEPVWFHDNDQWRLERLEDDLRDLRGARTATNNVESSVSRAQLLLQYLLAVDPFASESGVTDGRKAAAAGQGGN